MTTVSGISIYPIKSCGGIALQEATITASGLMSEGIHDRQWMVVDEDGYFLTQREYPQMALIRPEIDRGDLLVSFPDMEGFRLTNRSSAIVQPKRKVKIWDDALLSLDCGDEAASWFSQTLGVSCRLVRFDLEQRRSANTKWTGGLESPTLFSDGFPLLLIGQASLDDLNFKLSALGRAPLPMNRFRPNLVIDGIDAFEEDYLASLTLGPVVLKPVKPCPRCPIPSIDQETGLIGPDPLDVLQTYRVNEKVNGGITFGMNVILLTGNDKVLRVGQFAEAKLAF